MNDKKDGIILSNDVSNAKRKAAAGKVNKQDSPTAKKESKVVPVLNPVGSERVVVPTIYYWEDKRNGYLCGAFRWGNQPWGICFPYEDNSSRRNMDKKHLFVRLRDTLDILIHHGNEVVDKRGNINERKVRDAEATRAFKDPLWYSRTQAFKKVVQSKEITKAQAKDLNLL